MDGVNSVEVVGAVEAGDQKEPFRVIEIHLDPTSEPHHETLCKFLGKIAKDGIGVAGAVVRNVTMRTNAFPSNDAAGAEAGGN